MDLLTLGALACCSQHEVPGQWLWKSICLPGMPQTRKGLHAGWLCVRCMHGLSMEAIALHTWVALSVVAASGCSELAPGTHQLPWAPDMSGLNVPASVWVCALLFSDLTCSTVGKYDTSFAMRGSPSCCQTKLLPLSRQGSCPPLKCTLMPVRLQLRVPQHSGQDRRSTPSPGLQRSCRRARAGRETLPERPSLEIWWYQNHVS